MSGVDDIGRLAGVSALDDAGPLAGVSALDDNGPVAGVSTLDDAGPLAGAGAGGVGGEDVTVTVCPDGPLLVRGPAQLRTVDGATVVHDRRVIALCRCGRSRVKPLCDGSHRLSHFRDPATPQQLDHVLRQATPLPPEADGPEAA